MKKGVTEGGGEWKCLYEEGNYPFWSILVSAFVRKRLYDSNKQKQPARERKRIGKQGKENEKLERTYNKVKKKKTHAN